MQSVDTLAAYRRAMRANSTPDHPLERLRGPGVLVWPGTTGGPESVVRATREEFEEHALLPLRNVPGNPLLVVLDDVLAVKFWLPLDPGERQDFIRSAFGDLDGQVRAAYSGAPTRRQLNLFVRSSQEIQKGLSGKRPGLATAETVAGTCAFYRLIDPLGQNEAARVGASVAGVPVRTVGKQVALRVAGPVVHRPASTVEVMCDDDLIGLCRIAESAFDATGETIDVTVGHDVLGDSVRGGVAQARMFQTAQAALGTEFRLVEGSSPLPNRDRSWIANGMRTARDVPLAVRLAAAETR